MSHVWIVRPAPALGSHPEDVLRGVFDITGLAVQTVGRIDLQSGRPLALVQDLVHPGGTVALLGGGIGLPIDRNRDRVVF
jgi:hypothetical protein